MKKFLTTILTVVLILPTYLVTNIYAVDTDFSIATDTQIQYTTGETYVTVQTTYTREVHNSSYYYPASGEKTFHLPDLPDSTEEEISTERGYKLDSLSVENSSGSDVNYTVEELESGNGMYIKVSNYKQTTSSSLYEIVMTYNTHDYVRKVDTWVNIQAPALPSDIEFETTDESTGTTTTYQYDLNIVVDENISSLAKAYPTGYSRDERNGKTYYTFSQTDRIENSPYLEFGTELVYKFELNYKTPKTDNLIPEKYSEIFQAISTNIYEISLPREFSETNQTVLFSKVSPTPTSLYRDLEGNIIAKFEVPANEESEIQIEGYIWVEQNSLEKTEALPDSVLSEYMEEVSSTSYLGKYSTSTTYWEVNDPYIQQEASTLSSYQTSLLSLIRSDYKYVNDKLEYDITKATSNNERIGAKAALEGGASVCMEYADAMIAILRAQGVPARAALGYSNLEELPNASEDQVRHQWVQVWVPDYGWVSIDPTFESNNMKIGAQVDRVLWETFNGDSLSNIRIFSADSLDTTNSDDYSIKIYAVSSSEVPSEDVLSSYIQLIPGTDYESLEDIPEVDGYSVGNWINTFLKTTTVGKSLVITAPILILLISVTILVSVITISVKKIKNRKRKD